MKDLDLKNVEDVKEFEKLVPGGYVCHIKSVYDNETKEYLEIEIDISEGVFKNYFYNQYSKWGKWPVGGKMVKSYKEKALPFFKKFTKDLEKSNPGFIWTNNEQRIINLQIGIVFGEEEYENNMGEIKTSIKPQNVYSIQDIKDGKYTIPSIKRLTRKAPDQNELTQIDDDDDSLPF